MPAQLYLMTPADPNPPFFGQLAEVLAALPVPALLVRRGALSDKDYAAIADEVIRLAPQHCAVLIEGVPADVAALGADGLHVTRPRDAKAAVKALKPHAIVGVGGIASRDEAMQAGEDGADYVFFGSLSEPIGVLEREWARWWAETMEIPAVLSDPSAPPDAIDSQGCEFVALGDALWQDPKGAVAAAKAAAKMLEEA